MYIRDNIEKLRESIENVYMEMGVKNTLKLIAVTKYVDIENIKAAVACGIFDLGENRVQELSVKLPAIQGANWHMIGHLQTNKVKNVVGKVALIQSVDSIRLAEEVNKRAGKLNTVQNILLEVKTSYEETKYGIGIDEFENILSEVSILPNIKVKGIMTVAPRVEDESLARPYFKTARDLYDKFKNVKQRNIDFEYLSMGMSGDYKAAIREGSNMVRIGTAIFGERNKKELHYNE